MSVSVSELLSLISDSEIIDYLDNDTMLDNIPDEEIMEYLMCREDNTIEPPRGCTQLTLDKFQWFEENYDNVRLEELESLTN